MSLVAGFFFSSRRRHTRSSTVSWARRCVEESGVTEANADENEIADMLFAMKLAKHTKSNTIVFAKGGQLLASGTGQTSRVDALKQAVEKAAGLGLSLERSSMASDAFFPFPDCVALAAEAGIKNVIQPGGSINDNKSIDVCNELGLAMYTTGTRHFRH